MKNYIEHEIKVKFLDEYYAKNTEWTWFIEYVEENFETEDIYSWNEFNDRHRHFQDVYSFFMKIIEVSEQNICSENVVVKDIFHVARFGGGKNNVDTTIQAVKSNYGKLLLLIVWITKLENLSNNTDYLFDRRFLVQKNVWQIIKLDSLVLYTDELVEFCDEINVDGNGKIAITLKYNDKKSVISGLQRVSKPGLRTYAGVANMPRVLGGFGTVILSTNKGIMTGKNAKAANVGGEVLCEIW